MKKFSHFCLVLISTLTLFTTTACYKSPEPIAISFNNWIGYLPLYYIYKKGLLKNEFKFIFVNSLLESLKLAQSGVTQGFCGTQYELELANKGISQFAPITLLDTSNGGDSILSDMSFEQINTRLHRHEKIKVFLERQSISESLFKKFLATQKYKNEMFQLHHMNPKDITNHKITQKNIIITTYEPYVTHLLKQHHLKQIADNQTLHFEIIDAIFINGKIIERNNAQLKLLDQKIKEVISHIKKNPREFYETVKDLLEKQSFDDFIKAMKTIEWISNSNRDSTIPFLKENNIESKWVIQ